MTPHEWRTIVDEVNNLWGRTPKWGPDTADTAYTRFARHVTHQSVTAVIQDMFLAGRAIAPSPSEVIAAARMSGGAITQTIEACTHPRYTILEYHPDGTAAHTICAVCREESKPRPSRNIRSVGDIEQRRLETEEPEVM